MTIYDNIYYPLLKIFCSFNTSCLSSEGYPGCQRVFSFRSEAAIIVSGESVIKILEREKRVSCQLEQNFRSNMLLSGRKNSDNN